MIHCAVIGRLGADAEPATTQKGEKLIRLRLASTQGFGDKKRTNWISVSCFGERYQRLTTYLAKGAQVAIRGSLELSEKDGKTYLNLRADDIELLGSGYAANSSRDPQPSTPSPSQDWDPSSPF